MTSERRSTYADYIAEAIRFSMTETELMWPDETIIVAKSYGELSEIDEIVGMKVYAMDMPSSFDFFFAFPMKNVGCARLQKAFLEYVNLYSLEA